MKYFLSFLLFVVLSLVLELFFSFCLKLNYRSFISLCGQRNEPKKTTRGYAPLTPQNLLNLLYIVYIEPIKKVRADL